MLEKLRAANALEKTRENMAAKQSIHTLKAPLAILYPEKSTTMQHEITSMADARSFIEQIAGEIDNFHPLTDFACYLRPDSFFRRYTDEEAATRNKALEQAISVCETHTEDGCTRLMRYYEAINARKYKKAHHIPLHRYLPNQLSLFAC